MDITLDLVAGKLLLFYVYAIIVPYNGLFSKESFVQYTIKECSSKGTDKFWDFCYCPLTVDFTMPVRDLQNQNSIGNRIPSIMRTLYGFSPAVRQYRSSYQFR